MRLSDSEVVKKRKTRENPDCLTKFAAIGDDFDCPVGDCDLVPSVKADSALI